MARFVCGVLCRKLGESADAVTRLAGTPEQCPGEISGSGVFSMAKIRLSMEIGAPTNLVGAFFIPERMPSWYGRRTDSLFEVQRGASEFQVGLEVRISGRLPKRDVSLMTVVTAYQRGRLLEWRFHDAYGVTGLQSWEIERMGARSRVHMRDEYEMPGRIGNFWDRCFLQYLVRTRDRRDLEQLRRCAERRR